MEGIYELKSVLVLLLETTMKDYTVSLYANYNT